MFAAGTNYFPLLGVAIALVLMGVVWFVGRQMEKKRTEAWRQAADEMGFEFLGHAGGTILNRYPNFHLFSQGRARTVKNAIRGRALDLEVAIFDYSYTTGSGKNRRTWNQTVIAFEIEGARLPTFSIRPETMFDKIGQWFGYQDIDFGSHPRFSKSFVLRGQDEEAIRELFTDPVLEYYEASPNVCTEASGDRLVYYRASHRTAPADVRAFMEQGFEVLALFRPRTKGDGQ